jgi:hypothetical protein
VRISFLRSGGFVPIPIGCQIDTDSQPSDEAKQLVALVETSGIMNLHTAALDGACDVYFFYFEIETHTSSKKVSFDELSLPDSVRPLLAYLQKRSTSLLI